MANKPLNTAANAVSSKAESSTTMISLVYKLAMVCLLEGLKLLSGGEEPQRQLTRETIELNQRRRHLRSQSMHKIERDPKSSSVVEIKKNADVVIVRSASKNATSTVRVSRSLLRLQMERKARERQAILAARSGNGTASQSGVPVRRSVSSPGSSGLRSFSGSRSFLSVPKSRRAGRKNSSGSLRNSFSSSLESVREETQADLRSIQ